MGQSVIRSGQDRVKDDGQETGEATRGDGMGDESVR